MSTVRRLRVGYVAVTSLAIALAALTPLSDDVRAYASTGALTVPETGGGEPGSGATYDATTGVLTVTGTASISASYLSGLLETEDLTIVAASALIQGNIEATSGSNSLTIQTVGNIIVDPGVTINTLGGDIIFQSASGGAKSGSIRLGNTFVFTPTKVPASASGLVDSGGGDIVFGGGPDPRDGFAYASSDLAVDAAVAGVAMFGFSVNAAGGDIIVRGSSESAASTRSVFIAANGNGPSQLTTSGDGTISVHGIGSNNSSATNPWGIQFGGASAVTERGDITFTGEARGGVRNNTNYRGVVVGGGSTLTSGSGRVVIQDVSDPGLPNFRGLVFLGDNVLTSDTEVEILGNTFENTGTLEFVTPVASIKSHVAPSFIAGVTLNSITATEAGQFTVGHPTNSAAVTVNQPISVGGPATIHGSTIAIDGALSAPESVITLHASTAVSQTQPLTAEKLSLNGAGDFDLVNTSNNVATLAGGESGAKLGSLAYTDAAGGLTIGDVGSLQGIQSAGPVLITTQSGNLNLTRPVVSEYADSEAVVLVTSVPSLVDEAGDGDIIVTADGAVSVGDDASALLFSGSQSTSTGLSALTTPANIRFQVDDSTSPADVSPAIGPTGTYVLYRVMGVVEESDGTPSGGTDGLPDSLDETRQPNETPARSTNGRSSSPADTVVVATPPELAATGVSTAPGLLLSAAVIMMVGMGTLLARRRILASHCEP